jgi:hypothetical protein
MLVVHEVGNPHLATKLNGFVIGSRTSFALILETHVLAHENLPPYDLLPFCIPANCMAHVSMCRYPCWLGVYSYFDSR